LHHEEDMAKIKNQISVYLDPLVHKAAAALARAETRSLSQLIGHAVAVYCKAKGDPAAVARVYSAPVPAPIDASGLFRSTAPPKREVPPPAPIAPATPQEIREMREWNDGLIDDAITLEEFRAKRPSIAAQMGWDAPPEADTVAAPAASDPEPIRYTPREFGIPPDWVNEYGLTLEQQNAVGEDDDLEYWPPPDAPLTLAH
jgi:hypothetical protein